MRLYFATVILQSAKPTSGEKQSLTKNEKMAVLMRSDTSSLMVDRLCDKVKERNIAVACFYVDFAAQKVFNKHAGFSPETDYRQGGRDRREAKTTLSKSPEGDLQKATLSGRNCEAARDCHIFTANIYMR